MAGRAVLGQAPPTASYLELMTLDEIDLLASEFIDVENDDQVKAIFDKIGDLRKPIKELITSVTASTRECKRLREAAEKPPKGKDKGKGKGKKGKGKAGAGEDPQVVAGGADQKTFDGLTTFAPEIAHALPWAAPEEAGQLFVGPLGDYGKPAVLRIQALGPLMMEAFLQEYEKSVLRRIVYFLCVCVCLLMMSTEIVCACVACASASLL